MELNERSHGNDADEINSKSNRSLVSVQRNLLCGFGSWRPLWLQWLANHYAYSVAFILIGIIQGMSYTYMNGVVTTLERAFQLSSRTMGFVFAGNDVSQILCGLFLTHVATQGNRPAWMAAGIFIGGLSSLILASTQLFWDEESVGVFGQLSSSSGVFLNNSKEMCTGFSMDEQNVTSMSKADAGCIDGGRDRSSLLPAAWLFLGEFVNGIGGTTTFSLGFSYMDDNIKKRNSPLYIGLTSSMRSLGPILGSLLASLCLNLYIKLNDVPEYESRDRRWLGAWWLGFLLIGLLQSLFSLPMLLFPRELPSRKQIAIAATTDVVTSDAFVNSKAQQQHSTWKEFIPTMKRLITNPIMIASTVSFCAVIMAFVGLATFMPKYLEARFGQTASQANVLTGLTGQTMIMVGVFLGGLVVWKFKPRTIYVTGWTAFVDLSYALCYLFVMHLDCNDTTLEGVSFNDGRAEITSDCSKECNCNMEFDSVCIDGYQNFFSPCLAGCTTMRTMSMISNATNNIFYNCTCGPSINSIGRSGFCKDVANVTCPNLWIYLAVIAVAKLIVTSSRTGCIMIIIRSVIKEDKGVALTATAVVGSLFGFIPGPIIYGAAVDSTCLLWKETSCGQKGNCLLYDVDSFSHWFHGMSVFFITITVFADIFVVIKSRKINLYDEDPEDEPDCDTIAMHESMFVTRSNSIKDGL